MRIGVPKEIKTNENRVALVPAGAEALTASGHQVFIETGAGIGSGAHFAGEYFKSLTGTFLVHIPYKSTSGALAARAGALPLRRPSRPRRRGLPHRPPHPQPRALARLHVPGRGAHRPGVR